MKRDTLKYIEDATEDCAKELIDLAVKLWIAKNKEIHITGECPKCGTSITMGSPLPGEMGLKITK